MIVRFANDQVVTIQRTSKPIKAWILIAAVLMLLGALLATLDVVIHFAYPDRMGALLIAGATVFTIGFVVLLAARFMAWWKHG